MSKKEPPIVQDVELNGDPAKATLADLTKMITAMNKGLRETAQLMRAIGMEQALTGATHSSRSPAEVKQVMGSFVQGTEALTALQRQQNQGMAARASLSQQAVTNTVTLQNRRLDMNRAEYGTTFKPIISDYQAADRATRLGQYQQRLAAQAGARADVQQARAADAGRAEQRQAAWAVRAAHAENAPFRIMAAGEARKDVLANLGMQRNLDLLDTTSIREASTESIQSKLSAGAQKRAAIAANALVRRQEAAEKNMERFRERARTSADARADVTEQMGKRTDLRLKERGGTTLELEQLKADRQAAHDAAMLQRKITPGAGRGGGVGGTTAAGGMSGTQVLGMMPGGGLLNRAGQMFPAGRTALQHFGNWGGRTWGGASAVTGIGPALPNASGALGGANLTGGGYIAGFAKGGLGAGLGVAAGAAGLTAAGLIALGEYGEGKTRSVYGARQSKLIGMEATARGGSSMGGGQNLGSALESVGGMGGMAEYGMDGAQALSARAALLASRGSSERFYGSKSMNAVLGRYQVDPGTAGMGSGLGYSGDNMLSMAEQVHNAGAVPGATMQSLFAHEQRAASKGMLGTGVAAQNAVYVNELSRQGFGGGQYGAASAVQKLQGIGGGMADSVRGNMAQIADALVFANAVKQAGTLQGGVENVDKWSAAQKHKAIQSGGSAGAFGLFGHNFSWEQASGKAGMWAPDVDSPNFSGALGEADAAHQATMDQKALVSDALKALVKLDRSMEVLNATMADNIKYNQAYLEAKGGAAQSGTGIFGWLGGS